MRIYVAMAHYDPRGQVAPHVRRNILAMLAVAQRVVVVSTADLTPESEAWLREHVTLVRRENYGYDFFSYRAGLLENGSLDALHDYDRVVICNDSYVGPVNGWGEVFHGMSDQPYDFWGLTSSVRVGPHAQSFFVCFMPWVVRSQAFERFWLRMTPISDRWQVILRYEVGMSRTLERAGFARGSYFRENGHERRLGRRRVWWWSWLRVQQTGRRRRLQRFRKLAREGWNPSAAMADRVLDGGRMPIVKIDTLRYDPYSLGSDRLLAACEEQFPEQFGDVRAYLEETREFYPDRAGEKLPDPIAPLAALKPLVHYRGPS